VAAKTCFVVMAIGEQKLDGKTITHSELRGKYDGLIKEAILRARPGLDITRADDVASTGTISTDIIQRIMHSDYVIADVTYPNPNVFYELGLRHACRPGTIILKDKKGPSVPFDISHLRYIDYDDTGAGLQALSTALGRTFDSLEKDPLRPDSHLLETAKLIGYEFPNYKKDDTPAEVRAIMGIMSNPHLMELFVKHSEGEQTNPVEMISALAKAPETMKAFAESMFQSGQLNFGGSPKRIGEA